MAYSRNGYSNHGYCNQFDQYEYEQCNNGNIIRTSECDDFYFAQEEEHSFSNQPIRRRDSPIGANATVKYVEHPQSHNPLASEQPRRVIVSPNLHRRNVPTSPDRARRHTIIVSPARPLPPVSPNAPRKGTYDQLNLTVSPKTPRKGTYDRVHPPLSPQNELPLPPRNHLRSKPPLEEASFNLPPTRGGPTQLTYYTPIDSSTPTKTYTSPNKSYGDVTTSLVTSPQSRRNIFQTANRTAVISPTLYRKVPSPMCSVEEASKTSWTSLPYQTPPKVTLGASAIFLGLGGLITCVLGLYLLSLDGRKYYLDLGFLSGFTSLLLGGLGFRARQWEWLPNRNYVSGYVVLALFSVMTASGMIVTVAMRPKPGTPLADMMGGAVCGISVLSLLLAALGLVASHCCKYPPPDNRVEHGAEGFTL